MDLLIDSNPEQFIRLVAQDNRDDRMNGLKTLDDFVLCEILRYGIHNDTHMIPDLIRLYEEWLNQSSVETRFQVYAHVVGMIEDVDDASCNAFLPFVLEDDDRLIVATAVIDYVSLASPVGDDPMSRPREIVERITEGALTNNGAAFGALLHLGDPRVCNLIRPLRDALDLDAINQAVHTQTRFISACAVEFYIDWLEGMAGDFYDGRFGLVASGLGRLKQQSDQNQIFTGLRPFPFTKSMTAEEIRSLAKPVPLADYVKRIAPRLYALERSEPPPRIMPHVLIQWGLEPHTDPSEMATLPDNLRPA